MRKEYGEEVGELDICNHIVSLADITMHDNGEYLCIKDGEKIRETGFTSHNIQLFLNSTLGL